MKGYETILQFGAGNFLRAFVDLFVEQMNRNPETAVGRIVVVQSTGIERAETLNAAGGAYHVAIQGFHEGRMVNETEEVRSISRALHAGTQWEEVLTVARSPHLRWIVSNTTEAGFALDEEDRQPGGVPCSFPSKLLAVLLARFEAGESAPIILPCELIEKNAEKLRDLVLEQGARWGIAQNAADWIARECSWLNNLVDRIVPGPPREHPLLGKDPLLLGAEPFAFWAVEATEKFGFVHPAIITTADIQPYYLRKVRLLNGAHTALVCHALPLGLKTVRECVEHPEVGPWLERLLFEEIVPVLEGRVEDPAGFARATLDRFRNPFFDHQLSSIAMSHEAKVRVRLQPTLEEYRVRFGKEPALLSTALASQKS